MIKASGKYKKPIINAVLILLVLGLTIVPFAIAKNARFNGADEKAKDVIGKIAPDYNPWFSSIWTPPSSEVETFLFALQAAIGAGIVGYGLGYMKGKSKKDKEEDKEDK